MGSACFFFPKYGAIHLGRAFFSRRLFEWDLLAFSFPNTPKKIKDNFEPFCFHKGIYFFIDQSELFSLRLFQWDLSVFSFLDSDEINCIQRT